MFRLPRNSYEFNTDPNKGIDYILAAIRGIQSSNVSQIIAGTNVTISPVSGTGAVTINASGGGSIPTLDQVTTAGNTTTNAITVGGITSTAAITTNYGTLNRTTQLRDTGLYLSRTSDGQYVSYVIADGSMYYNTRNHHIFLNDGIATMRLTSDTRNVLIGTTTDAGYKLDVNGTAALRGTTDVIGGTLRIASTGTLTQPSYITSHSDGGWNYTKYTHERGAGVHYFTSNNNLSTIFTASSREGVNINVSSLTNGNPFSISGTVNASSAVARGQLINTTLVATANNDVLVGLDINPTFNNGSYSSTQRHGVRIQNSRLYVTGTYSSLSPEGINPDSLVHIDATINGRGGSRAIAVRVNPTINVNSAVSQTFAAVEINPTFQNVGIGSSTYSLNSVGTNYVGPVNIFGWSTTWLAQGGTSTYHYVGAPNGQGFRVQINSNIAGYSYEFDGSGIPTYTLRNNNIDALKVYSTGNVGIGTTTDAGYKLDVNGTAKFTAGGKDFKILDGGGLDTDVTTGYSNLKLKGNGNTGVYINIAGRVSIPTYLAIGDTYINASTPPSRLIVTGSQTATSALAQGVYFNNTLVAAANNDVLVGLDINPTFTNGAFTGVSNLALRTQSGNVVFNGGNVGIGTSSPSSKFHVNIASSADFILGTSSSLPAIVYPGGGYMTRWKNDGSEVYMGSSSWTVLKTQTNEIIVRPTFTYIPNYNVGIGTTTDAGYKLDVNGSVRFKNSSGQNTFSVSDDGKMYLWQSGGTTYGAYHWIDNYTYRISPNTATPGGYAGLNIGDNSGALIQISTSHRIMGINNKFIFDKPIAAPRNSGFGFETYSASNFWLAIKDLYTDNNTSGISFSTKNAGATLERMRILTTGEVGIGTTAPAGPLHVKYSSSTVPGITIENDGVGFNAGSMTLRSGTTGGTNMSVTAGGGMYWYNIDTFSNTLSLPSTGNLIVGGAVDAGFRLDVQGGDARFAQNVEAASYSVAGNAGYSGIVNFPGNPPGSQNLEFLQGILINVF